jgi:colicin import membrane protein
MSTRNELRQEQKRFSFWVGIAAAGHVAVIAAVVLLQFLYVRNHPPLKIVNVSLVSLPGAPGPAGGPKSVSEPAPSGPKEPSAPEPPAVRKVPEPPKPQPKKIPEPVVAKKAPEPVPVPKKEVPVDKEKQSRQNLQATLDQLKALEKLKNKTAAQKPAATSSGNPGSINNALANLQKKVATQGGGGPASSGAGSGGGGGLYGPGGGAVDPYRSKIAGIIQNNWSFSNQMLRTATGMEVYVAIYVLPDGSISQTRYDRKSSSEYLNSSVKMAIQKSGPLPPLPREYGTRGLWIGFVFTPEGINH